jgi:3-oxoacyl-[acyl-carrier protein] reductase
MDLQIKDRIALVTGGSKGIGASIVRQLAREGAKVILCARPSPAMTALETEVLATGGACVAMPVDVFDAVALRNLVNDAAAYWGGLDILVNNVGGPIKFGGFEELSDEDWMRAFEFNVMSMVRFARGALPYLRKSELKRIINISSISASQPGSYNPHYTVTKAAIINLSKYLANALVKDKILVNTVCPGPVHSDSWEENILRTASERRISETEARALVESEESAKIPLGVVGEGEQIASVVALLASPLSDWTTGSCFHVNGGKMSNAF